MESLRYSLLIYISEFIKILDDSNDWFILSRFSEDTKRRAFYEKIYEEKAAKADLILEEGVEILTLIKEFLNNGQR